MQITGRLRSALFGAVGGALFGLIGQVLVQQHLTGILGVVIATFIGGGIAGFLFYPYKSRSKSPAQP
jgi:hypothetical protein